MFFLRFDTKVAGQWQWSIRLFVFPSVSISEGDDYKLLPIIIFRISKTWEGKKKQKTLAKGSFLKSLKS